MLTEDLWESQKFIEQLQKEIVKLENKNNQVQNCLNIVVDKYDQFRSTQDTFYGISKKYTLMVGDNKKLCQENVRLAVELKQNKAHEELRKEEEETVKILIKRLNRKGKIQSTKGCNI